MLLTKCSMYSRTPLSWMLVIRIAHYQVRLCPSGKYVENSTKLTCLEITGYLIKYSTVLWLLELQTVHGWKVSTQVHTVNSTSLTSNCQCSLFLKKNPDFLHIQMAQHPKLIQINGVLLYMYIVYYELQSCLWILPVAESCCTQCNTHCSIIHLISK